MKVWRIGSNWGGVDIFPIFEKNKIAFAGPEVEGYIKKVSHGDLIAITKGQEIVAIAKASKVASLADFDTQYVTDYDDVSCIVLSNLFTKEANKTLDFGIYDGRGKQFHEAHHDYKRNIISIYKKIIAQDMLAKTKELLLYKKQIILQGPPGTGKTRLAQIIADGLIVGDVNFTPLEYVKWYIKSYEQSSFSKHEMKQRNVLLNEFSKTFPIENITGLTLDEYCRGKGSVTSFCYWIEIGLKSLGRFSPGQAGSEVYGVYYHSESKEYRCESGDHKYTFEEIKAILKELLTTKGKNYERATKIFRQSLILKILASYFPEDYFPIFSQKHLKIVAKILDIYVGDLNDIELNKQINIHFNDIKESFGSEISSYELMGHLYDKFKIKSDSVIEPEIKVVTSLGESRLIQFHPSFTYEDFVRGITAVTNKKGQIEYTVENKILSTLAKNAITNPAINYVLIIDEINRANLSSVLGELIYALEYRGKEVESMYEVDGSNKLTLPSNLYIIGTMNTADRSVGHIDYAIRRRFAFVDVLPKVLNDEKIVFNANWFQIISELFIDNYDEYLADEKTILKAAKTLSSEFRPEDVWLGHSYFIQKKLEGSDKLEPEDFKIRIDYEIKPILLEYVKDGVLVGEINKVKIEDYIKSL
ncbi:AAA family ATPase [Pedobacter sp. UBA5917]|jgi:hypothetical protein|uniref:AAA family ATPase n=1 Tax=Pedobacter sp. UBA5917 TaxID=1947061 RepID=UPI0025DBC267|nr:AAA family ATPase [Pedobacter sp. UBA5917]